MGAPERILQDLSLVHVSEDPDCYQSSRQQALCSATCQCDGSQKAQLGVCSNKTVVPAALVSVHLWALKIRLLRGHNTASPPWNMMGVTAGAKVLMSTVSEMSFHFLRKTLHLRFISRSEQCPQPTLRTLPEGNENQDNSCRVNNLPDFCHIRIENEAWTLAGEKQNQAPTCTYTFWWERNIIRGWLFLQIHDGIMSYSCFSLHELQRN